MKKILFKRFIGCVLIFFAVFVVVTLQPESIEIKEWCIASICSVMFCGGMFLFLWDFLV